MSATTTLDTTNGFAKCMLSFRELVCDVSPLCDCPRIVLSYTLPVVTRDLTEGGPGEVECLCCGKTWQVEWKVSDT